LEAAQTTANVPTKWYSESTLRAHAGLLPSAAYFAFLALLSFSHNFFGSQPKKVVVPLLFEKRSSVNDTPSKSKNITMKFATSLVSSLFLMLVSAPTVLGAKVTRKMCKRPYPPLKRIFWMGKEDFETFAQGGSN
jgi:hypothetical protein